MLRKSVFRHLPMSAAASIASNTIRFSLIAQKEGEEAMRKGKEREEEKRRKKFTARLHHRTQKQQVRGKEMARFVFRINNFILLLAEVRGRR